MAEEAFRVALETATAAAQAAQAALAEIKRSQASGLATKPKELELTGKPEEDRRLWSDWKFGMVQFLMTKDQDFQRNIEDALTKKDPIEMSTLSDAERDRSRQLFSFLAGTLKGRLLALLREAPVAGDSNGFEAVRRIQADIEPTSGAAALGLLETIMSISQAPKGTSFRDAILSVERLFADYEGTAGVRLSEHIKIATLRRLLPPELKVHVNMLVKDDTTYDAVKKAVTEYEVADRRYQPLKPEAVFEFDHGGNMPMEIDQVQAGKAGSKGKKGGKQGKKDACKTCGKTHPGACWYKDSSGKGKGKPESKGKGKGTADQDKAKKPACQICGKTNHSADKCFQRYKDKDQKTPKVQAVNKDPEPPASSSKSGAVAALTERDVDTSPETELRATTTGVHSVTKEGQGLALLDTGSDEHMCPHAFADWIESVELGHAPRLRDAQGAEIKHDSRTRTVKLRVISEEGTHVNLPVTFVIGPVRQPIISMGKLRKTFVAVGLYLTEKYDLLKVGNHGFKTKAVKDSIFLPFFGISPKENDPQIKRIHQIKMLKKEGPLIKFRAKMGNDPEPIGTRSSDDEESETEEAEVIGVSPRADTPRGGGSEVKAEAREEEDKSTGPVKEEPAESAPARRKSRRRRREKDKDKAPTEPIQPKKESEQKDKEHEPKGVTLKSPEKRSSPEKKSPEDKEEVDWGDDSSAEEEEEEESSQDSLEYERRARERAQERNVRERSRSRRGERPRAPPRQEPAQRKPRWQMTDEEKARDYWETREAKRRQKEAAQQRKGGKGKGKKGGRGRRKGKEVRQVETFGWVRAVNADESQAEEPSAPANPSAEVKVLAEKTGWHRAPNGDPVLIKQDAIVHQTGYPRYPYHNLRTTWVRKDGNWEKIEDRVNWTVLEDPSQIIEGGGDRMVVYFHQQPKEVPAELVGVDVDGLRVVDLKARLKSLGKPIWGAKDVLRERLKEVERKLKYDIDVGKRIQQREEELSKDPMLGREPMELPGPEPPSVVERQLHELTHLPFAPWCEACVRGRGKDAPHQKLEITETRLTPVVALDWFEAGGTDEIGQKSKGPSSCLLLIDVETGYVAAIPAASKGSDNLGYLADMVIKFLKLMRHERVTLRTDNEPVIKALANKVKGVWSKHHPMFLQETPVYSSQSNGRAERAIQTVRRLAASLKMQVELKLGIKLTPEMHGWPRVIRHAAWTHNRFHVKLNGRTCFEELYQTRYKHDVVPWGERVLFMQPKPFHRRVKGGKRRQKMDASMETGVWLGRAEESDEHLVGTPQGVQRARTVRRLEPDKRWDAEAFLGFRGLPWNVAAEAAPLAAQPKVKVHFALPPSEVVKQPDGELRTHGGDELEDVEEPEMVGQPLEDYSPSVAPDLLRSPASKREGPPLEAAAKESPAMREQEPSSPSGTKRESETPAEALDPRVPQQNADGGGVLEIYDTMDEETPGLPEEALESLESDALGTDGPDHPDNWSEERWITESQKGKAKELGCLESYGVYQPVPRAEAIGGKYITARWEEVPKKKNGVWIVRSRFVAREFRWQNPNRDDVFGVTSSANTGRILDFLLAKNDGWCAYLADCQCAFFHAPEKEICFVEPPDEWKEANPGDWVWQLKKQLYGRQIAPRAFCDFASGVLTEKVKLLRCIEVPHLYAVGPGNAPERVLKKIAEHMTLTIEGPYKEGSTFTHLKRVRIIKKDGITISPSPNHLKKLLELTDLTMESKGRDTPVVKTVVGGADDEVLPETMWTKYRAVTGILMYVSTDRADIQYTVNELSSMMSRPTVRAWEAAKHLVRYMLKTHKYALHFGRSLDNCDDVLILTDSDWGTDAVSRKSKTCVHVYIGDCLLYSYTRRQTVVAQSSAEAEFYATASGVSEGILIRKVMAFFEWMLGLRAVTDSAANNAMSHRLGVGKVRHLETKVLWLQQLVYEGKLVMTWKPGRYNNADLGTKVLPKSRLQELVAKVGLKDPDEQDDEVRMIQSNHRGLDSPEARSALAVLISCVQVQRVRAESTEEDGNGIVYAMLGAAFLAGMLAMMMLQLIASWCYKKIRSRSEIPLRFYKAPCSKVVHTDEKCVHLKKSRVETWHLCKTCKMHASLKLDAKKA